MVNPKNAFWQALLFTLIIFGIGFIFGFFIDSNRLNEAQVNVLYSEVNLLDQQIRQRVVSDFGISCELSKKNLFEFADRIYEDALKLENYESVSIVKDSFTLIHKRYDLLRVLLWSEAIELKDKCGGFHTLVYLYDYSSEDVDVKSKQRYLENLLLDVKNENPGEILLIPIAGDMDLESTNLIKESYNISQLPVLVIDEKEVLRNVLTTEELQNVIFYSNKPFKE